jgi:hypothetical protein
MFQEFKRAWKQAVENFWEELEADGDQDAAYREVARVRNQMDQLDEAIADTRTRLEHETEQVQVCVRRERMAKEIGDEETAGIAADYRERHQERASVLERKLDALEAERDLCRRDLKEMEKALQAGRVQAARAELEDLNRHPAEDEFRNLEDSAKAQTAQERLDELKKRMGK